MLVIKIVAGRNIVLRELFVADMVGNAAKTYASTSVHAVAQEKQRCMMSERGGRWMQVGRTDLRRTDSKRDKI